MTMTVSICCDGCGEVHETSTDYDAGANEIDGALEAGWTHKGSEDYCPECSEVGDEAGAIDE